MDSVPSTAAQIMITVIPIVAIVMGTIVTFFYLLWSHKQRMSLIERGLPVNSKFDLETFSLLTGLLTLCIGIVLSLFFLIKEGLSYNLLGGLVPLSIGISFIVFYRIKRNVS